MVESSGTSQQPLPPPRVSCCKPRLTLLHHPMTLQHLLVPVDFSEGTPATLALVVRLAGKFSTHGLRQMNSQACLSLSRFSDLPTAQLASGAPEVRLRTNCAVEYTLSPGSGSAAVSHRCPGEQGTKDGLPTAKLAASAAPLREPPQGWGLYPIEVIE